MTDRVALLSNSLRGVADAFIVPSNDEFQGEYTPEYAKRLEWLSGFTGSAGSLVVLATPFEGKSAAFFTDGRYTLQARTQVGGGVHHFNSSEPSPATWLARALGQGGTFAYDSWLHTHSQIEGWRKTLPPSVRLVPLERNPVDELWADRPAPPQAEVLAHPIHFSGQSSEDKIAGVVKTLKAKGASAALLALPDGINWLLNIRGSDIPYNPLLLCFAVIDEHAKVRVFAHDREGGLPVDKSVDVLRISALTSDPMLLFGNIESILMDPAHTAEWFFRQAHAAGCTIIESADPTLLPKACKNAVEQEGIRAAHRRDGVALTCFLGWLKESLATRDDVTELDVEAALEAERAKSTHYRGPSFATIAGAGPHGAIVHYRATEASNRTVGAGEIVLVDSGGQYPDGTTDVTRTTIRGTPTDEMKDRFTRVLKGHIALATMIFPAGTTGAQLDVIARHFLWQVGLDYDHGTGHGVGAFLCVHEGPQGISKRAGGVALEVGMILSNEPGYYKAGEYGIRIENLVMVIDKSASTGFEGASKKWMGFETLTLAPIDETLIDWSLMTPQEIAWLTDYHARVAANNA